MSSGMLRRLDQYVVDGVSTYHILFSFIYGPSKHLYLPVDAVENSKDLKLQDNILLILWSITLHDIYFSISHITMFRLLNRSFLQSAFPLFISYDIYCTSHSFLFSLSILSYVYRLALYPCVRCRLHHKYVRYA